MTCYLTDDTSPEEVQEAKSNGVVAYKLYPAGATTNSSSGVTDFQTVIPTLKAMADVSIGTWHFKSQQKQPCPVCLASVKCTVHI